MNNQTTHKPTKKYEQINKQTDEKKLTNKINQQKYTNEQTILKTNK